MQKIFKLICLCVFFSFNSFALSQNALKENIFVVPDNPGPFRTVKLADAKEDNKNKYVYHTFKLMIIYNSQYNANDSCTFEGPSSYPLEHRLRDELHKTIVNGRVRSVSCRLDVGYYMMCYVPKQSDQTYFSEYVKPPTNYSGWELSHVFFPKSEFKPSSPQGDDGRYAEFICVKEAA